ncbi:13611_t:CDS:2, partial [Cetraspora pellucida]
QDQIRKIRKKLGEETRKEVVYFEEPKAEIEYTPEEPQSGETKEEKEQRLKRNAERAEEVRQQRERRKQELKDREEDTKRYHKELKALGKSGSVEEYLKSSHKDLYPEEAEELRKLQIRKGKLGRLPGRGTITHAPDNFIKEPSKDLVESSRMHYEFCGELGIKRLYQSSFEYQPEFYLFQVMNMDSLDGSANEANKALGNDMGTVSDLLKLPFIATGYLFAKITNILAKIATLGLAGDNAKKPEEEMNKKMMEILKRLLGAKIYFTIGPKEHDNGETFFSSQRDYREVLFKTPNSIKPLLKELLTVKDNKERRAIKKRINEAIGTFGENKEKVATGYQA